MQVVAIDFLFLFANLEDAIRALDFHSFLDSVISSSFQSLIRIDRHIFFAARNETGQVVLRLILDH